LTDLSFLERHIRYLVIEDRPHTLLNVSVECRFEVVVLVSELFEFFVGHASSSEVLPLVLIEVCPLRAVGELVRDMGPAFHGPLISVDGWGRRVFPDRGVKDVDLSLDLVEVSAIRGFTFIPRSESRGSSGSGSLFLSLWDYVLVMHVEGGGVCIDEVGVVPPVRKVSLSLALGCLRDRGEEVLHWICVC
jgi:hypothetical protein